MRTWLGVAIKLGVTLPILAIILSRLDVPSLVRLLSSLSYVAILAFFVVLIQTLFVAHRFSLVAANFGVRLGPISSLRITLESTFFSQTFVSFLGGDAYRIWKIRRLGLPLAESTSAVMLDRLLGLAANHLFLLASLPWLLLSVRDHALKVTLVLLTVAGIGGFGSIMCLGRFSVADRCLRLVQKRIRAPRAAILLVEAATVGRHFWAGDQKLTAAFVFSLIIALGHMVVFAIILLGMHVDWRLVIGCALLVPFILEVIMLPISIAGWGVREGAAILAFGGLGLPADQALGASIAFGVIGLAVSLIGGFIFFADRSEKKELMIRESEGDPVLSQATDAPVSDGAPLS